jgi:hypothetical protein
VQTFLSESVKVAAEAPTATGTTTILSAAYDMSGWDGIMCIVRLGSPATNNNIRATQCTTSGGSYADLAGSLVGNNATDNPLVIDLRRPQKQFIKFSVARGTTTTIDSMVVIQYRSRTQGQSQPSGTQIERWMSPAEGTA